MSDLVIKVRVNGRDVTRSVAARKSLVDFLREDLELTGTHIGCEHGVCGACTVALDGEIVRSCLCLAVQVDGRSVETIEGLSDAGELTALQDAFLAHNAAQCGFCTPGMLIAARDLIVRGQAPDRAQIREHLSGNVCRCTGYQAIIDAVESVVSNGAMVARP